MPAHATPQSTEATREKPASGDNPRSGSVRFVFRGDEYWIVAREPSLPEAEPELTPAEQEVLLLLRAGSTYEQIAARRGSSRHTVAKQVTSVLRKLKVASQRELEPLR